MTAFSYNTVTVEQNKNDFFLPSNKGISTIEEAISAVKRGEFVVVLDNEDRENEGDLIMPAEFATQKSLAFMIRYCSGVICCATIQERLKDLRLPLMVPDNNESRKCKFTVSVDLKEGTSTGISAEDRSKTIRALGDINTNINADSFTRPGHIFPLLACEGGVIQRAGHTEAAIDIARLAGCFPAGYLCEINNDEGVMMRRPELEVFAKTHNLHLITISDLIRYRFTHENHIIPQKINATFPRTPHGDFEIRSYTSKTLEGTLVALVYGNIKDPVYQSGSTSVHFVEPGVLESIDAQWAEYYIAKNGSGILIYIEGQKELISVSGALMAKQSIFGMGSQMLRNLGISRVQLLSAQKIDFDPKGFGIEIESQISLQRQK